MVSDYQLFYEYQTQFPELTQADASEILSSRYNLSYDSVRGRISRSNTLENRIQVGKDLQEQKWQNKSILRQEAVIKESNEVFNRLKDTWNGLNRPIIGYFISDRHIGAPQRTDYWTLTLRILDREPHVDVFSALNDWQDHEGWGRWDDTRSPKEKIWSSDIQNSFDAEDHDYRTIRYVTKNAVGVGVAGNHDLWWYNYIRARSQQSAEMQIAVRMEELRDTGILLFNRMTNQNHVNLSRGLVWEHGTSSAKRASSRARAHLPKHMTDTGQTRSVSIGHSHQPALVNGAEIDLKGCWFANAGTFMDKRDVRYAPDRLASGWGGGIVRWEFKPNSLHVNVALIEFRDVGGSAVAIKNGTVIDKIPLQ